MVARPRSGNDARLVAVSRGLSRPNRAWHHEHWRHPIASAEQLDMRISSATECYAAPMNRQTTVDYTQPAANHRMRAGRSEAHSRPVRCTKTERYAQRAGPSGPPRAPQGPHLSLDLSLKLMRML